MSPERKTRQDREITPELLETRKIAFVFPPQGTQQVGMGRELFKTYKTARSVFEETDSVLGFPLSEVIFSGPKEALLDTVNQQPALLTVSEAMRQVLLEHYPNIVPQLVAGHSLGEYAALVAADVLDFSSAIQIVRERGRIMKEAGEKSPGRMAAVLGLTYEQVQTIIDEVYQVGKDEQQYVQISNENSPLQYVVSGLRGGISSFIDVAKRHASARVLPLQISIASHSGLMEEPKHELAFELGRHDFRDPKIPIVQNVNGLPMVSAALIKRNLLDHMVKPVKWTDSLVAMQKSGIDAFIEIGQGNTLTKLMPETIKDTNVLSIHVNQIIHR